jgi:hypothetical protein
VEVFSVQVAVFEPVDETWTILHVLDEVPPELTTEPPPPLALQETELTPPAIATWRTRGAFVHVQPLPGQLGPA